MQYKYVAYNEQKQLVNGKVDAPNETVAQDPATVEMIRQGVVDPARVITHRFPLARIEDAFALLAARREGGMKVAIIP